MDAETPAVAFDRPTPGAPDAKALRDWLATHLPELTGPLELQRLDGGQSNPSWVLRDAGQAWVLRARPGPAAALLPSAHAIEREFRVLRALADSDVPVPRARVLCEDESVIGAAFYIMDFVPGRIFRDPTLPELPAAARGACHAEAVRVLAALHTLDWRTRGLADFGRAGGFFSRSIRRWTQQYRASAPAPDAAMEQLAEWLPTHLPAGADDAGATTLTHGDFRLENLLFDPQTPRVAAVLDWELSTLGHPMADLAYLAMAWQLPPGLLRGYRGLDTRALGLPSADAVVRAYAARTGQDPDALARDWPFYLAFNLFRLGAILHGVARRERDGLAASASAAAIGRLAPSVAARGWAIARGDDPA